TDFLKHPLSALRAFDKKRRKGFLEQLPYPFPHNWMIVHNERFFHVHDLYQNVIDCEFFSTTLSPARNQGDNIDQSCIVSISIGLQSSRPMLLLRILDARVRIRSGIVGEGRRGR